MPFIITNITSDPFAIGTLSIASVAWLVTFIGAIASQVESYFFSYLWWGIMFQMIVNVSIIILYMTDTVELYRTLLAGLLSIAFVYTTNGANSTVYSTQAAKQAAAAGCILLSIVNLAWLLYFAADPNSPTSQWVDSFSGGQRRTLHSQAPANVSQKVMTENSANPFGYSSNHQPYMASSTQLNGLENGEEPTGQGYYSNTATAINASNELSDAEIEEEEDEEDSYPYTVKALYNYDANPADATELSFVKGEILKVQSTNGRWWQARNVDGKVGILPSNYVEKIDD